MRAAADVFAEGTVTGTSGGYTVAVDTDPDTDLPATRLGSTAVAVGARVVIFQLGQTTYFLVPA